MPMDKYFQRVADGRNRAQIGPTAWAADYPSDSSFLGASFTCRALRQGPLEQRELLPVLRPPRRRADAPGRRGADERSRHGRRAVGAGGAPGARRRGGRPAVQPDQHGRSCPRACATTSRTRSGASCPTRRGCADQPPPDQLKRVSASGGASVPGRTPRRTSSTGHGASRTSRVRAAPMPSRCQRSERPVTTAAAPGGGLEHAVGAGAGEHRLGAHAGAALERERRVGEQAARVAPALRRRPRRAASPRHRRATPRAPRPPSRARCRRTARGPGPGSTGAPPATSATSQAAARSDGGELGVEPPVLGRREQQDRRVLLGREPHRVLARRLARERGDARARRRRPQLRGGGGELARRRAPAPPPPPRCPRPPPAARPPRPGRSPRVHTASAARAGCAVGVSWTASAGSWARMRASSARSSGPGSIPISSISRSRAAR